MADYADAAANAEDALTNASEGMIEEYEIRTNGRRVKRGKQTEQVAAALLLEAIAARRAGRGICTLGKFKTPRA
jgi:hypothetical protein